MKKIDLGAIEDRLLGRISYRTIMSLFWPYQRAELLAERKSLLEFCTLMIVSYLGVDVIEGIATGTGIVKTCICLFLCSATPVFTKIYWYILSYTYDVVVPPIESNLTVEGMTDEVVFIDEFGVLHYLTPQRILVAVALVAFMYSPNTILAQIMQGVKIAIIAICILAVIDACWVAFSDYKMQQIIIDEEFDDPNDRFQLDWSDFAAQQADTEEGGVKIIIMADLDQSDEANQAVFLNALTSARKIVADRENNQ